MAAASVTFNDIYLIARSKAKGSFTLGTDGLKWESISKSKTVNIPAADITSVSWVQFANQLIVQYRGGLSARFDGFRAEASARFSSYCEKWEKELKKVKNSTKGWNWGDFKIKGNLLDFCDVDGDSAFSVPLSSISQSVIQGKNEVALEFHQDDTINPDDQSLVEMRLYVPPHYSDDVSSGVQKFDAAIREKTDFGTDADSKPIIVFEELLFMVPRGRFTLELYTSYFRMFGKTFSYKMMYDSVNRLFLLPAPNKIHRILVIELDPPIRQGRTSYPYLIIQFREADEMDVSLALPEDKIQEIFGDTLKNNMTGSVSNVASRAFRGLTKKKVLIPGSFSSVADSKCVRCSLRANDGFLYVLEKSFFFLKKPILHMKHSEIDTVEFARVGTVQAGRTFDFVINAKGGVSHTFTGINRNEYDNLIKFVMDKNLKVANFESHKERMEREKSGQRQRSRPGTYAEDEYDPYLQQMDAEMGSEGESGSEDDEDYTGGSESESEGDFSGESGSDSGDDAASTGEKRKKKRKEKEDKAPRKKKQKKSKGPKRAMSAYLFFTQEKRPIYVAEHPDAKPSEVMRALGDMWKAVSTEDRAPYEEKAAKDKERYLAEKAEYPSDKEDKKDKKKKKKKKTKVKRSRTAFNYFATDWKAKKKAESPEMGFGELQKGAAAAWKELEDKTEWEAKAAEDKVRFQAEEEAALAARAERKKAKKEKKERERALGGSGESDKKKKKKDKKKEKKAKKDKKKRTEDGDQSDGSESDDGVKPETMEVDGKSESGDKEEQAGADAGEGEKEGRSDDAPVKEEKGAEVDANAVKMEE